MRTIRLLHTRPWLALLAAAVLAGCSTDSSQPTPVSAPPPTRVLLRVEALPDINPDQSGRPSPVLLRIYQLRATAAFEGADFFALFQNDRGVLAADLLHKDEFILRPGDKRELRFEAQPDTQVIAAYAAFRQLDTAQWRVVAPVTRHGLNTITLRLSGDRMLLSPSSPPPRAR